MTFGWSELTGGEITMIRFMHQAIRFFNWSNSVSVLYITFYSQLHVLVIGVFLAFHVVVELLLLYKIVSMCKLLSNASSTSTSRIKQGVIRD